MNGVGGLNGAGGLGSTGGLGSAGSLQQPKAASDLAIKSGLNSGKDTAGIPAPKSYLEPTKKLAPSSFAPVSDEDQPRRVGIYRVPTGGEDKK